MKVIVAIIDLIENLLIPLIPCPLVQPLLNRVPNPTRIPAIINKITELEIDINSNEDEVIKESMKIKNIADILEGKKIIKQIFVPNKILNLVI